MEEETKKVTIGGVLSWLMVALGAFIIIILIYFLIDARPPKGARDILVNEQLSGASDVSVWYQKRFDQPYYVQGSRIAVNCVRYIKPVDQWQITVQANVSVFRDLAEKKGLPAVPDSFSNFRFRLYDDAGREYTAYDYADFSKTRHRYRRLIFDAVNGRDVSELTLDIYYKDETEPTVSIPVYDAAIPLQRSRDRVGGSVYDGLKHNS